MPSPLECADTLLLVGPRHFMYRPDREGEPSDRDQSMIWIADLDLPDMRCSSKV